MNPRRRAVVLVAVVGFAAVAAAPAAAAPAWDYGLPEQTQERTCLSLGGGPLAGSLQTQVGTDARVGMLIDPQNIPKVGEVFYGAVVISAVGGCTAKYVIPEVIPPLGVDLAISAENPVRCRFTLPDGSDTSLAQYCPQTPLPGTYGGLSLAPTPQGDPNNGWSDIGKIPGTPDLAAPRLERLYLEFPLRSTRPLNGLPGNPTCASRVVQAGPCRRQSAGDFLQAAVQVFAGGGAPTLAPALGLTVGPGGAGAQDAPTAPSAGGGGSSRPQGGPAAAAAGGGGSSRLVTAPATMRIRSALRGVRIEVAIPADGARVSASLSAPRIGRMAVTRRSGVRAGRLRLRLKPTRRAARRLLRARTVSATVRVSVRVPGRPTATGTTRLALRR